MSSLNPADYMPSYQQFVDNVAVLDLAMSASELHGLLCAYLCAGEFQQGEHYLAALFGNGKKDSAIRTAASALFELYSFSKHQITHMDFAFALFLPDDNQPLADRARAFSEWCHGFTQGMTAIGVGYEQLEEEESQEALQHLFEFSELDYQTLDINEEDEKSLMEVSEYARMAVLRLSEELHNTGEARDTRDTAH